MEGGFTLFYLGLGFIYLFIFNGVIIVAQEDALLKTVLQVCWVCCCCC